MKKTNDSREALTIEKRFICYDARSEETTYHNTQDEALGHLLLTTKDDISQEFIDGESHVAEITHISCIENIKEKKDFSEDEWADICPEDHWNFIADPSYKALQSEPATDNKWCKCEEPDVQQGYGGAECGVCGKDYVEPTNSKIPVMRETTPTEPEGDPIELMIGQPFVINGVEFVATSDHNGNNVSIGRTSPGAEGEIDKNPFFDARQPEPEPPNDDSDLIEMHQSLYPNPPNTDGEWRAEELHLIELSDWEFRVVTSERMKTIEQSYEEFDGVYAHTNHGTIQSIADKYISNREMVGKSAHGEVRFSIKKQETNPVTDQKIREVFVENISPIFKDPEAQKDQEIVDFCYDVMVTITRHFMDVQQPPIDTERCELCGNHKPVDDMRMDEEGYWTCHGCLRQVESDELEQSKEE